MRSLKSKPRLNGYKQYDCKHFIFLIVSRHHIQCSAIIMQSVFSKFLTICVLNTYSYWCSASVTRVLYAILCLRPRYNGCRLYHAWDKLLKCVLLVLYYKNIDMELYLDITKAKEYIRKLFWSRLYDKCGVLNAVLTFSQVFLIGYVMFSSISVIVF